MLEIKVTTYLKKLNLFTLKHIKLECVDETTMNIEKLPYEMFVFSKVFEVFRFCISDQ